MCPNYLKSTLILIAVLVLGTDLKAQNFSQEFLNTDTIDGRIHALESNTSGYTLGITKIETDNDFRNSVKLISTNLNGDIQDVKRYQTTDANFSISTNQIISLPDGSKIVSGSYSLNSAPPYEPYIMLLNPDGSVNWAKKITTNRYQPPTLKLLSDNTLLVIFNFADPQTHKVLCKVDLNGNFSAFNNCSSFINGSIANINTYATNFEIMLLNGNLINITNDLSNVNWQRKYYNEIGLNYNRTANGDYIFASAQVSFPGYMTVFRTDASGNLIWAKYIEAWEGATQSQITVFDIVGFNFIKEDSNGNIITSANSEGGLNGSFNVALDANGNYISNTKIETFQNMATVLHNDTYLIGGFTACAAFNTSNFILENRNLLDTYQCDNTLSHTIADGTDMPLTPDTLTLIPATFTTDAISITFTTETMLQNDFCNMQLSVNDFNTIEDETTIFPNPANHMVWVKSSSNIFSIKLFNALGQCIQTTKQSFIDISKHADGLYFLEIETKNNSTVIKKLVKN